MSKVKKYSLAIEQDFDYYMIGICSHHSDYRVAWGINDALGLKLAKAEEQFATDKAKKHNSTYHSFYEYYVEEDQCFYYLIKNASFSKFLVAEQPKIDFFLFINKTMPMDVDDCLKKLNTISSVLAVFEFDPEEIESMHNITF